MAGGNYKPQPKGSAPIDFPVTTDLPPLTPEEESLFGGLDEVGAQLKSEVAQGPDALPVTPGPDGAVKSFAEGLSDGAAGLGDGAIKAVLETKDFVFGDTPYEDRTDLRKRFESQATQRSQRSTSNSITTSVSQFVTGLLGAGKLMAPFKVVGKGKAALEVVKAAGVGAIAFDPQDERLSNLVESYPSLQNPVSRYLAADPMDSDAEGRLKSAVESIGLDVGFGVALAGGMKLYKALKGGNAEEIKAATGGLQKYFEAAWAEGKVAPEGRPGSNIQEDWSKFDPNGKALDTPVAEGTPSFNTAEDWSKLDTKQGAGDLKPGDARSRILAEAEGSAQDKITQATTADVKAVGTIKKVKAPEVTDEELDALLKEDFTNKVDDLSPSVVRSEAIPDEASLHGLVKRMSDRVLSSVDANIPKTVISDAKLDQQVRSLGVAYNTRPEEVMSLILKSGANGNQVATHLEVAKQLSHVFSRDISALATQVKYGIASEAGPAIQEIRRRLQLLTSLRRSVRDIAGGSGRTLRRMRSEFDVTEEQLTAWVKADDKTLVEVMYQAQGDLGKVREATTPGFWKKVGKVVDHHLINGPLWWFNTHVWNGIGGIMMLGGRPLETLVGSVFVGGAGRAVAQQSLKEYRYMAAATRDSFEIAVQSFMKGDSLLSPHDNYYGDGGVTTSNALGRDTLKKVESPMDVAENAMRFYMVATGLPTRFLGMQDEFFKQVRYRGMVQAKGAMEAEAQGLKGIDAENYIKTKLSDSFDEEGRAVDIAAMREAQQTTFTQPLLPGTMGAKTQNFIEGLPLGRGVIPFIRTPVNAFRHGWKMTPGLNLFQKEYRQMLGSADPATRARAWGQMAIGSSVMALSGMLAMEGRITGAGPRDPSARSVLISQGWRPYSYVIKREDGTKTFIPLSRLDPVSLPLGIAADIADMMIHPEKMKDAESLAGAAMLAVVHNITDKTFLISLNSMMRAALEPEKNMGRFLGNMAEQAIPGSSLLRGVNTSINDPYMKEARGLVDNALDRMPGYSKSVPIKYNPLGEPMMVSQGLWSNSKYDRVDEEIGRMTTELGEGLGGAQSTRGGIDLRDVTLEDGDNAFAKMMRLSAHPTPQMNSLRETLLKVITSKSYAIAVDGEAGVSGTKLNMIAGVISKYRETAYKKVLADSPILRTAITKRQRETGLAIRENMRNMKNQPEGDNPIQNAIDLLGAQ